MLGTVAKMLARAESPLDLGITQVGVTLDERPGVVKESCYFLVCHLVLTSPWVNFQSILYRAPSPVPAPAPLLWPACPVDIRIFSRFVSP